MEFQHQNIKIIECPRMTFKLGYELLLNSNEQLKFFCKQEILPPTKTWAWTNENWSFLKNKISALK